MSKTMEKVDGKKLTYCYKEIGELKRNCEQLKSNVLQFREENDRKMADARMGGVKLVNDFVHNRDKLNESYKQMSSAMSSVVNAFYEYEKKYKGLQSTVDHLTIELKTKHAEVAQLKENNNKVPNKLDVEVQTNEEDENSPPTTTNIIFHNDKGIHQTKFVDNTEEIESLNVELRNAKCLSEELNGNVAILMNKLSNVVNEKESLTKENVQMQRNIEYYQGEVVQKQIETDELRRNLNIAEAVIAKSKQPTAEQRELSSEEDFSTVLQQLQFKSETTD